MVLAERVGTKQRALTEMNGRDGLFVGVAQALALIPGVSRSGATISAGLFRNFDRVAAARYSFLLSVPAVVLSGLFELRKVGENGSPSAAATAIATLVAFVSGYAAIAWLIRYLGTHTLGIFVVYRIALGTLVLVLTATGDQLPLMHTPVSQVRVRRVVRASRIWGRAGAFRGSLSAHSVDMEPRNGQGPNGLRAVPYPPVCGKGTAELCRVAFCTCGGLAGLSRKSL